MHLCLDKCICTYLFGVDDMHWNVNISEWWSWREWISNYFFIHLCNVWLAYRYLYLLQYLKPYEFKTMGVMYFIFFQIWNFMEGGMMQMILEKKKKLKFDVETFSNK